MPLHGLLDTRHRKRLLANRGLMVGFVMLGIAIVAAASSPFVVPYPPNESNTQEAYAPPLQNALLGN